MTASTVPRKRRRMIDERIVDDIRSFHISDDNRHNGESDKWFFMRRPQESFDAIEDRCVCACPASVTVCTIADCHLRMMTMNQWTTNRSVSNNYNWLMMKTTQRAQVPMILAIQYTLH
jgi:hypothetical protein